jgi:hypothetical protein
MLFWINMKPHLTELFGISTRTLADVTGKGALHRFFTFIPQLRRTTLKGFNAFDIRLIVRGNINAVLESGNWAREFGGLVTPTFCKLLFCNSRLPFKQSGELNHVFPPWLLLLLASTKNDLKNS